MNTPTQSIPANKSWLIKHLGYLSYFFFFALKALETLLPYGHGDALYYHLVGPKFLYHHSVQDILIDLPFFLQAGIFDLIYIIPFFITKSLMWIQICGQFLHFFFSLGIGSIICLYVIRHHLWGPLAGIALLTISGDSSFFLYAKNDGALALILLITALHLHKGNTDWRSVILTGFLLGLLPAIKINGLIFSAICWIYLVLLLRTSPQKTTKLLAASMVFTLILIPTLYKNYLWTGNPLFPALINIFPGKITEPMRHIYTLYFNEPMTILGLIKNLLTIFQGKIILIIFPIVFLYNLYKKHHRLNHLAITAVCMFLLYLLANSGIMQVRFIFGIYFILIFFIFYSLAKHQTSKLLSIIIVALVLIDCKLDKSISHINKMFALHFSTKTEKEIIREQIPLTHLVDFIHKQDARSPTYIISDELSDSYYLPEGVRLHSVYQNFGPEFLMNCDQNDDLIRLKKYSYALLAYDKNNPCYHKIKQQGKLLSQVGHYKLYSIFEI